MARLKNHVVHILIDKRHTSTLHVQSRGGADFDTVHYLVVAKVMETLSAGTGGTYHFLKESFFLTTLNGVEDNSIGSKLKRYAALENLDDSGEIYRASGNTRVNIKTSARKCVGHDYYKNHKSYFEEKCSKSGKLIYWAKGRFQTD
jgi:hypothetical protein